MPRLLVTNCGKDGGGIYLVETGTGQLQRLVDQPVRGITPGPDGIYAVTNHGTVLHLEPGTWKATPRAETGFRGCHDFRWLEDAFYLVACYGNRVVRLDPDLRSLDEFRIVDEDEDVCHANCLARVNGELLLSIFTLSPGRREEKRHTARWRTEGKVLRLDWERKRYEVLHEPLAQPHSLRWHAGELICCESFTSEITSVSLARREKRSLRRLHGFVRGLEFAEGSAYVGISKVRKSLPLLQRLLKPFRMRCGVVELDATTWTPRRRFRIPGSEVYEILAV